MKEKRWNAGFSLVELLLAIAIVAALCGFGLVSVIQQRKNLKVMEAEETAKEIFLAAQEHLTMAAAQGRLQPKDDNSLLGLTIASAGSGVEVKDDEANVVAYAVFDEKSVSGDDDNNAVAQTLSASASAADVMLPQGAIDEFILNQRYAISYNAEAYRVMDVFYTEDNDYVFKHSDGELWTEIQTWVAGKKEVLTNPGDFHVDKSQKAVIMGWYGEDALLYGADGKAMQKPSNPQGIKPGLDLVNGPILFAVVSLDTNYAYSDVHLKIDGANGGSVSIPITPFATSNRVIAYKEEDGVQYYLVILDDVTKPGFGFNDLFSEFPDSVRIAPGSDIQVTVEARGQEAGNSVNLDANSETLECNSLFADNSSVFTDGADSEEARIKNFRHLQNLSNLTPGDNLSAGEKKPVHAELEQDMDWKSFKDTVTGIHSICRVTDSVSYHPVNVEYELKFDGGNKTIRNLEIDKTDSAGNAGVFGTLGSDVKNSDAAIQNLKLENTTVSAPGAKSAGTLIGSSHGALAVENVVSYLPSSGVITATDYAGGLIGYAEGSASVAHSAAYSKDFATDSANGGAAAGVTATGANGVAGGLIGAIKTYADKTSSVTACAAANKVTADDADGIAGGLLGQVSGKTDVSYSYAGGVTAGNGKYEHRQAGGKDTLQGAGNVQGAYAGGLIGQAADNSAVKLENAYSAASVYGSKAADGVYTASSSADVQTDGVVYGAGEYQRGASSPIKTGTPAYAASLTTDAKPYDAGLLDANAKYPYASVKEMGAVGNDEWITNHVGDWPKIDPLDPKIVLHNEELLYVDVFLDDCDYSAADLEITGPNGTSVTIRFPFDPDAGDFKPDFSVDPVTGELKSNLIPDPVTGELKPDPSAPQRVFPKKDSNGELVRNADGKICYVVILDDVTQEHLGFGDIKSDDPNNPANPIPLGSQINVQAHATSLDGRSAPSNTETCNSLFADNSSPTDAHITNFRHLENLNKLNDPANPGAPVTATLDDDICWTSSDPNDQPFKEGVARIRGDYSIPSSGDPVYTPVSLNDTTFNGNGNSITNLEVAKADDNGNAGVFGTLTGNNAIENLELENVSVTAPNAKEAGALIGHSEGTLTVTHVESHSNGPIKATEYAGGLIGYAEGDVSVIASASYSDDGAANGADGSPGSVTATASGGAAGGLIGGLIDTSGNSKVEGCAAANVVTAEGADGVAGGLIGQADGTVGVKLSYAGGVTTDSNDPASVKGAHAGGLIGHSDDPTVTIEKSYSSAAVSGGETGSLSTGSVSVLDPTVSYGADRMPLSENPVSGKPYDKDLLDPNNSGAPAYPYNNIIDMLTDMARNGEPLPDWFDINRRPDWIDNHVGDWPPVKGESLPAVIWGADGVETVSVNGENVYTVKNDSARYAWINLKDCDLTNQPFITLSVSNLVSGSDVEIKDKTGLYTFKVEEDGNGGGDVTPQQSGSPNATYTTIGPDGTDGGTGKWLRVTLDDITEKGQRFSDLFPNLNPAQEIRIHAKSSEDNTLVVNDLLSDAQSPVRWDGTDEKAPKPNIASPLYDIALSGGTEAGVTNIRHLQNLDTSVSGVGSGITSAKLAKDLDWKSVGDDWSAKSIYVGATGDSTNKSFYGIENPNLTNFDGQGHTLSNFVIDRTNDSIPDGKDAGLFRTLTGDAKNLNLESFTVTAGSGGNAGVLAANAKKSGNGASIEVERIFINTNNASVTAENYAGGLIGCAEGPISVTSCASYSKNFANGVNDGVPGSVTATGVDGVAGGLIGAIKGAGGSTVENCAAANLVTANGADGVAGGLIGQASGKTDVSYSYAGGVTAGNGQYEHRQAGGKDTLQGAGNVQGAYAGGLIGQAADESAVKLENAYSAASVYGSKAADGVYTASSSADVQTDGVVYGAGEYQQGSGSIRVGTPVSSTNPTTGGKPYDADLLDANAKYPYASVKEMGAGGNDEWITNHVGDWPVIPDLDPKIVLHNEELLYVDVFLDDCDYSAADLEITGPNGTSVTIRFPFDPDTGDFKPDFSVDPVTGELKSNLIPDPDTGELKPDPSAPQRVFPKKDSNGEFVRNADGKICYVVILDDVTQEHLGFGDIKSDDPNNPANPIPFGSQINVQAHATSLDGRSAPSNTETCNSLFADNSSPTDAHITNFRHLENLSKLNDPANPGAPVTATLEDDICWTSSDPSDQPFKEGVAKIRDEYSIPSSGDPVYTPVSLNDTTFKGDNHAIKNLEVVKADDNGNAGVFGTLTGNNAIEKLKLEDVSVTAPDAKEAGALIGHSEGDLTVKRVESHSDGPIKATEYAGGLIGYAEGDVSVIASASYSEDGATSGGKGSPGSVTATGSGGVAGGLIGGLVDTSGKSSVEGCAAANKVTADATEGVAGGLIGQADGTVGVKFSYAGGVITDGDPTSVTGAHAGGLIGHSDDPTVTIEKSYSSAAVSGGETGNLSTGSVRVLDPTVSYGADNLKPRQDSEGVTPGMPYSQELLDETNPENAEYPYRGLGNIIAEGGAENLPEWLLDGSPIPEWVTTHVGDWPPVKGESLPAVIWGADGVETVSVDGDKFYTVANDDVRYAWINLKDCDLTSQPFITLSVSNLDSGNSDDKEVKDTTTLYTFEIRDNAVVDRDGNPNATYTTIGPGGSVSGEGQWLRVTLDDITAQGQRFRDLFPDLNPAQEIRIHAKASDGDFLTVDDLLHDAQSPVRWDGTDEKAPMPNIASPLYDMALSDGAEAGVTSIRHLQNLDASVSGVGDEITSAKLAKDLDWEDGDWNDSDTRIYTGAKDDGYSAASFYGIKNENLTSFDGQGHTLSNFVIDRASGEDNLPPSDNADAGLFRALTGSVGNLNLEGFTVTAGSGGNAGVLAANAKKSESVASVNVENVFINAHDAFVMAENYAGGMIGYAEGPISVISCASYSGSFAEGSENGNPGSVTATGVNGVAGGLIGAIKGASGESKVEGCAAANIVKAEGSDGVAGGLIGQASGSVDVSYSYAGGVTTEGGASVYGGAHAAGLIGQTETGVNLKKVYSSATAEGNDTDGLRTGGAHIADPLVSYGADDADETRLSDAPAPGLPYNAGLLTDGSAKYPYESLQDMIDDDSPAWIKGSEKEWITNHVGDWPKAPSVGDPPAVIWGVGVTLMDGKYTVANDDARYAWIKLQDYDGESSKTVTLAVSNASADNVRVTHTFTIAPDKNVTTAGALKAEYRTTGPDGESGYWLRVVLDDITTPGQRFHDLFPTLNPALEVRVRAGIADRTSAVRWTGTEADEFKPNVAYVLYDVTSGASEAIISNIRHLQNLDPSVSHVGETVKTATLVKDLDWTEGDEWNWSAKSIRLDGDNFATSFYGIENANLTMFDGRSHTLRNFVANRNADAATAPDANAGLFRNLMGVARNLKLDNFTAEARANGNAGVLAANATGSAEVDTVLAISAGRDGENWKATVTGRNAGGLVGEASGSLKIANSAATVIARGADTSGGLVGASSAQLIIEDSYAGGHTTDGRYDTTNAASYNIQGGASGGLVGAVSGGSLKAKQSFSAASVSPSNGAAGGGLIGSIASGVSAELDSVYVVAPVDGVSAGVSGEYQTGAVAGVAQRIINAKTFYLAELYKGYSLANSVRTSGTPNIFSDAVKLAYYDRSDFSNEIAARSHDDTMEIKTYPYDTEGLRTSDNVTFREYPFSIWTTFTFDNGNTRSGGGKTYGVYYGDWQPILPRPTVNHDLRFLYRDPLDGQVKPVSGDENLIYQKIQEGKDNKTLLPYLAHIPGQRLLGWYLTDASGQPDAENVFFAEDKGYITIPAEYCETDRYVTALFEKDPDEYAVSFVYDPSGQNRYSDGASFERIGRVLAIDANNANVVTVPSRSVDGYLFKGWYTNPELTEAATFSISNYKMTIPAASSKRDYTFYAKYEKPEYELVTVDFMYQTEGGELEAISSVPVFQPEDVSQYQIQILQGQGYSGWVKLPSNLNAYTALRLLDANKMLTVNGAGVLMNESASIAEANGERFRDANAEVWIDVAADGTKHYVMLYESNGIIGDAVTYSLRFVHDENVLATPSETLTFPKKVTPRLNLSADRFKMSGYRPTGYSSALNADGQTGVITVTYAPQSYTLSFNTGDGSYIPAKSVPSGEPLSDYRPSENPTQTGYTFGGWEKLYRTGDESAVISGGWDATMPAYNVEAKAKWNPANVNYTVLFWYENPNDDNESYMGSVTRSAPTGSEVSGIAFSNYPNMSHTHSVSCYPGASSTTVSSSNIQNPSATNGDVRQGKGTRYSANRYIYINGRWYLYSGSTPVGSNAPHEGENYDWIDRTHFYHDTNNVETKVVNGDGSTILNVHFKRNLYTFTLKDGSTTLTTFTAKYQQRISDDEAFGPNDKWSFRGSDGRIYSWARPDPQNGAVTSWEPPSGASVTTRILRLEIMPGENITFTRITYPSRAIRHFYYYVESLGSGVHSYNGMNFDCYLDYDVDFNYAYYTDEFFLLNGFTRYGATKSGVNVGWTATNGSPTSTSLTSTDVMRFYYTRNSYDLEYSVGGSVVNTASVKYQAPLSGYTSYTPARPASVPDDYSFEGWYLDPECTRRVPETTEMPDANMIVFGKWSPPDHKVTFDVNGGTMTATQTVFEGIKHGSTLSGIADESGQWLDSYTPTRDNYTFIGWFYGDVRFIPTQAVKENLDLTAVWEPAAATTYANVTIEYVYLDGEERVPFKDDDGNAITEVRENLAVNSVCVAQAEYFEGYYPLSTLDSILVVDNDENNVITFVYRKIQMWNYSLEYYAYYRSYETSESDFSAALGADFSGFEETPSAHYINTGVGAAYSQYQSVMLTLPEAFKARYHFHHYEYDGETGYDTRATIHPDGNNTAVIKVYLEPDPSLLAVSDRVELYDGNPLSAIKGRETLSEFTGGNKTVKAEIMNVYRYFDANGAEQPVKDADAYRMRGYTVLKVDVTQSGSTTSQYYLLYKDENESDALNLRIRRRAVTLTSESASKAYDGEPLKKDGLSITGDGFAQGEGCDYAFSVEAFRLDAGTSDNSFTYSLWDDTQEKNYDVTVVFGTLTVTEN